MAKVLFRMLFWESKILSIFQDLENIIIFSLIFHHYYSTLLQQKKHQMNKPFYGVATMPQSERSNLVNNIAIPGPGTYDYNQQNNRNDLPKWSLRKQLSHGSCFQNLSITPAPGAYEYDTAFTIEPQKKIITKGERYKHYIQKYFSHSPLNLPGCLNLKGGFSFGYREAYKQIEKSPGPIYHLDKKIQQQRVQKIENSYRGFGFGQKNVIYKGNQDFPGPGTFDVNEQSLKKSKTCQNWTFGGSKRVQSPPANPLGPGEYDPKIQSTLSRSFKIKGKTQQKSIQLSNLGPGSYELPDTKTKIGTKFNIRKSKQTKEETSKQDTSQNRLSPFTYNPPRYLDRAEKHGYSLGKRLQSSNEQQKQSNPGPGAYQICKKQFPNRGGYMGRKVEQKKKQNSNSDNFYKYDPIFNAVTRESPKFTFPQSRRYNSKENVNIDSRSQIFYQTIETKKSGYSYSMGTSKRFCETKKKSVPFKQSENMYSTMGQLPSYLKKGLKKK